MEEVMTPPDQFLHAAQGVLVKPPAEPPAYDVIFKLLPAGCSAELPLALGVAFLEYGPDVRLNPAKLHGHAVGRKLILPIAGLFQVDRG